METKVCKKCGGTDWTPGNQCRACKNEYERQRVRANPAKHRAACKRWKNLHQKRANQCVTRWMKDEAHRKEVRAAWCIKSAIRRGTVIRPDHCCVCGSKCKPQAHHQDYDSPLAVDWVCRKCHVGIHNAVREIIRIAEQSIRLAKAS